MKSLLSIKLSILLLFIFSFTKLYSQSVTISTATAGLASAPFNGGSGGLAILGVQLSKAAGGPNTITSISFSTTTDPNGKFINARLYGSTNATFDGVGAESLISTGTLNSTNIAFSGTPLTNFGAASGAVTEFYFLVIDVVPGVTAATVGIQTSLTNSDVIISASTVTGSAITGTNYTFIAPTTTISLLTNGIAASPLQAGATNKGIFGFSLISSGAQTVTSVNIQVSSNPAGKWGSYSLITSTDADYSTTGDNSLPIGGLTFTASSSQIAITGLSFGIPSSAVNFFLIANINVSTNTGTASIQPSLISSNVTVTTGTVTGSATGTNFSFAPVLTVTNLSSGLAGSPLNAGASGQGVFGFNLSSSGSQTVTALNIQVSNGSPTSKWSNASYQLITSTDASFSTSGDNSAAIGGLTFTPSATQIAITGLSQVITTGTNYFLVVNIDPGVSGATSAIQPSLGSGDITLSSGGATGAAIGINYSFSASTASFTVIAPGTAPVISGTILSAGSTLQVLTGFSVTSSTSQQITAIAFNYTGLSGQWAPNEYLYKSTSAGTLGSVVQTNNTPTGNFNSLTETINSTPVYYYLVVDVSANVTTSTPSVTTAPTEANITLVSGNKNTLSINRTFTFNTSQTSDIIFTGGSGSVLNYKSLQAGTIDDLDFSKSHRLGTFRIQDGGTGLNDEDDKPTSITSLTIQVTNPGNIYKISLFNEDAGPASEISGTEQSMPGSGTVIFNPSSPIHTPSDGGILNLIVRVTFKPLVTDNDAMVITVTSVTGEAGYSGFALSNAGGATSSAGPNHTIIVNATKLILQPGASPNPSTINTNFGLTIKAVDSNPFNNIDLDYNGKVDLTATGGSGTLSGGSAINLSAGTVTLSSLKINQSGSYVLIVSDDDYTDVPELQTDLVDASGNITITSSSSSITLATTTPAIICYGNSYFPLSNIVITETDAAGISGTAGSYTFSIALPSGFVFDQSITTGVSTSGGSDITIPAAPNYSYPSANIVQFSFNLTGTSNVNTLTLTNLKVGRPHPGTVGPTPTGPLTITRSGGNANIAGVASGTTLGTVNASEQAPAVSISVSALTGDIAIDPNTTSFNVNANAVNLVANNTPGVFTGSGVTFVSPNYRFNPNTLAPGAYPITYTYDNGCQSVGIKTFTVFTSGINGLSSSYCNNDPVSSSFTVNQTFIDQRMGGIPGTWSVDHYVYYSPTAFNFVPITTPTPSKFDPSLPEYQSVIQYFGGQIPIGFAVCNGTTVPCNGLSATGVYATYQMVTVKTAPSVSFSLPADIYSYCEDNVPLVLTGSPANSNNVSVDKFDAGAQSSSISHSIDPVSGKEVWKFSPAAVTGVTSSTSQLLTMKYSYKDIGTGCSNSYSRVVAVHDRPTIVPASDITNSTSGSPSTNIILCQKTAGVYSFSASDPAYNYRWYSNPLTPGTEKNGTTFYPGITTATASSSTFYVTREKNGCESINNPLSLSVAIIALPASPSPVFSDAIRQYCVGAPINNTHLEVPGTNVKWFNTLGTPVYNGSTPTAGDLGVNTLSAATFTFNVTQTETVNSCEGPPTILTVKVEALPDLSITADSDPSKICTTGSDITFSAFDNGNIAANGMWTGVNSGSLNPFPSIGQVVMDPSNLLPNTYSLKYTYKNSSNCSNSGTISVTVLPTITPSISVGNVCDGSAAVIINNSSISASSATIAYAEWEFGDGSILPIGNYSVAIDPAIHSNKTTGTYESPLHIYPNTGTFQIKGVLTTSDGCRYPFPTASTTIPVNVSPLPKADFKWQNACVNSVSSFKATTNLPSASIQSYLWNFSKNGVLDAGIGHGQDTTFIYTSAGKDIVRLIVTTIAQCKDTVDKPVYIVPTNPGISSSNSYQQDFTINDGWITGGKNSSWALGTPAGSKIIGDSNAPFSGNAWDTNLTGSGNSNESSWVLSGCFDFSGSSKPVISLDVWSDDQNGVDGAVLQYNVTGNIEDGIPNSSDPDGDWEVVGNVGAGINWYDDQGISNSPGNQTTVSAGWTGRYNQWKKAIFKLDPLAGKSNVVFRVAFASAQPKFDGFAFDNVFIGERSRIVLVENFTNASAGSSATIQNNYYKNFGSAAEVVKIQYHTPFPGTDPINDLNHEMHNSRAAFYGITEAPTMRVDGTFNAGNPLIWVPKFYDDRILTPSVIKLHANTVKDGQNVKINVSIENLSNQKISLEGVHIFTTIVQKSVTDPVLLGSSSNTEFVYVARQMLPSPSGLIIPSDLPGGETFSAPEITWSNSEGDAIAIFVQSMDSNDKNVYQSILIDAPPLPDVITSVEQPLAKQIKLFPTPANQSITIQLPNSVSGNTPVKMFDVNGREVYQSTFMKGNRNKTIITQDFAAGVYLIQFDLNDTVVRKKVMVMHE